MVNPNTCKHLNIHFEDLFKEEKINEVYCLDCGETKGKKFAVATQRRYCYEIDNWLKSQGIRGGIWEKDWINFLKDNDYYNLWLKAYSFGDLDIYYFEDESIKQNLFLEFTKMIEYLCLEFKKQKEQAANNSSNSNYKSNNNCLHKNIHWEDFFKPEKQNDWNYHHQNAYCLDCGAIKGRSFANQCQSWYLEKIGKWFDDELGKNYIYGIEANQFSEFIKENYPNFEQNYQNLKNGKLDEEYFDGFGGQMLFFEVARSIEKCCLEFKEKKQNSHSKPQSNNKPNREREREREQKSQLQSQISSLENKPNKTKEEEAELARKKKDLDRLNNQASQHPKEKSNWLKPVLIMGGVILVSGLVIYLIAKNKQSKR
ncbi:MAG: Ribonuclease Y [Mycoplasmataceae bacterium]|nr:MAG: Ribonuclease Y [Mycoplasmataceae bacterium]